MQNCKSDFKRTITVTQNQNTTTEMQCRQQQHT